jgi:hypothetical protein
MNFEQQQQIFEIKKKQEERDALNRPERAKNIINFLTRIKAYEFFHGLVSVENKNNNFDTFKSFITKINGIARDIPIKKRNFDGKSVVITGGLLNETVLPPQYEDKEELLKFAFESAEKLNNVDKAYLMSVVINSLHMFNDGNGRVSRIINLLLTAESKESFDQDLEKALGADGRYDAYDINPRLIDFEVESEVLKHHGWSFEYNETGHRHIFHDTLKGGIASAQYGKVDYTTKSGEYIKKYHNLAGSDIEYILTATLEALSEKKYEAILWNKKLISPVKMQELSEDEWMKIFSNYRNLKKEHVKILIDIFKNPTVYRNPNNQEETLKDFFIRRVKEEYRTVNK